MAHLTCATHNRRALVFSPEVGPLTLLLHREDGSRCDGDSGRYGFVKYRGHIRTQFTVLIGQLPKTQALKKEQWSDRIKAEKASQDRTISYPKDKSILLDLDTGRVQIVQTELRSPRG